jgi:hypothetical protein
MNKGATSMKHSQYDDYLDHSDDLVARVRRAKEAAQRKMEEFGDPSEYDITIIRGKKKEEPPNETNDKTNSPVGKASCETPASPPQSATPISPGSVRETSLEFVGDLRDPHAPVEED